MIRPGLAAIVSLALCTPAAAQEFQDRSEWAAHFQKAGTQGTFVLYDLQRNRYQVSDRKRAETRFLPASTFKIPNSLIALETGAVKDETALFKWDGTKHEIGTWNRDHTLRTAMKYSVVPIYQGIARKIGEQRMRAGLAKLHYGNGDISGGIDRFWLDGGLRISPMEQVQFLVQLYKNALPLGERSQRIVKDMMLTEATADYILRAKTGFALRVRPGVAWWVGWVERDDNTWFFALNMDAMDMKQFNDRITISKAILASEGILPKTNARRTGDKVDGKLNDPGEGEPLAGVVVT